MTLLKRAACRGQQLSGLNKTVPAEQLGKQKPAAMVFQP
jgi:hypothetical protein